MSVAAAAVLCVHVAVQRRTAVIHRPNAGWQLERHSSDTLVISQNSMACAKKHETTGQRGGNAVKAVHRDLCDAGEDQLSGCTHSASMTTSMA